MASHYALHQGQSQSAAFEAPGVSPTIKFFEDAWQIVRRDAWASISYSVVVNDTPQVHFWAVFTLLIMSIP